MARARDALLIDQNIGEHDINRAVKELRLEEDRDFIKAMRDFDQSMKNTTS